MTYICPQTIPAIPNLKCKVNYGQVQKIAFQRIGNEFSSLNPIQDKASWTRFLAAIDKTKLVITPYVEAPTSEGGDEKTFGGGNETRDGIETIMGINPVKMSFALRHYPQDIISALKVLTRVKDLGVYFFNGNGQILALKEDDTYKPIPIRSLFVGDLVLHGLSQPDRNTMSFSFKANYSDKLVVVTPNFSPINDLENIDVHIGDGSFSLAFNPSFDI